MTKREGSDKGEGLAMQYSESESEPSEGNNRIISLEPAYIIATSGGTLGTPAAICPRRPAMYQPTAAPQSTRTHACGSHCTL